MSTHDLLTGMRSGQPRPDAEIEAFVYGVVQGTVSRPQAAAWLAWAWSRGLTDAETVAMTRAMTHSGDVLSWGEGPLLVDKHSTGGVGDKVSLVLAPLWAELGFRVPMISGRGLGHTGGTLDKLEAIPGFRADLSVQELQGALDEAACFISGQTAELAPADRVLYALRNEACAVDSIPFQVSSILSKKLAEGAQKLVLDVKTGSGSFTSTEPAARRLAEAMVRIAKGAGVDCSALITAMDRPLGWAIGNANEVVESIEALQGGGPTDLRTVVLALAQHPDAERVLDSGAAFERFKRMVAAQGGDPAALDDPRRLRGGGTEERVLVAERSGHVRRVDALAVGRAVFELGAGRLQAQDPVDFGVGVALEVKPGDAVERGRPLARVTHRSGHNLELALRLLSEAIEVGDTPGQPLPLVVARVA